MPVDIVAENALPGTYTLSEMGSGFVDGDLSVVGFARSISKNVGETMQFSINGPATILRIFRFGSYSNGKPFREVATLVNTPTTQVDLVTISGSNGATTANHWTVTAEWDIPETLNSGIYIGMIRNADNTDAFYTQPFVVRDDAAVVDIIYKTSDTTWGAAYNCYGTLAIPRGKNLYGQGSGVANIMDRSLAVSYMRPNITRGSVQQTYIWACELPMIEFLERNGYSVKYISSIDLDQKGVNLLRGKCKILLTSGHDEYWSQGMWDAVISFRDNYAGRVITMAGNDIFWRVRFEYVGDEVIMWCYKDTMPGPHGYTRSAGQPFDPVSWTGTWIDTRWSGRPTDEQIANGVFGMNGIYDFNAVVKWSNHKVWWGSSLHDLPMTELILAGVLGFEADHIRQFGPDESYVLLAVFSRSAPGGLSDVNGERYDVPGDIMWGINARRVLGGGLSVDFNTCQWAWSLSTKHERGNGVPENPSAQQFTINLLNDLGATPATLMAGRTLLPRNSLDEYGLIPGGGPSPVSIDTMYDYDGNRLYPYLVGTEGSLIPLFDDSPNEVVDGNIYVDVYVDLY